MVCYKTKLFSKEVSYFFFLFFFLCQTNLKNNSRTLKRMLYIAFDIFICFKVCDKLDIFL